MNDEDKGPYTLLAAVQQANRERDEALKAFREQSDTMAKRAAEWDQSMRELYEERDRAIDKIHENKRICEQKVREAEKQLLEARDYIRRMDELQASTERRIEERTRKLTEETNNLVRKISDLNKHVSKEREEKISRGLEIENLRLLVVHQSKQMMLAYQHFAGETFIGLAEWQKLRPLVVSKQDANDWRNIWAAIERVCRSGKPDA